MCSIRLVVLHTDNCKRHKALHEYSQNSGKYQVKFETFDHVTDHVIYLVFLLTVDENEAVFAGGATDLDDGASFLFHGEVAEDVKLDLLSGGDLDLPGTGGGAGGDAVSDAEG